MTPSPSFSRHLVVLRMTRPAGFHFNHGGAINGALCAALRVHPLPVGVIPFACESGRVRFEAGDAYHLGVTLVGPDQGLRDALERGLARLGETPPAKGDSLPALAGNFEVEAVHDLAPPDLDAQVEKLRDCGPQIPLRFVSPLLMTLPRPFNRHGLWYANPAVFPPGLFLRRLWGWLRSLALRPGRAAPCSVTPPPVPLEAAIDTRNLVWVGDSKPRRRRPGRDDGGVRVQGLQGSAVLAGVSKDWLPTLVLGRWLHLQEKHCFGLGRYLLAGEDEPFRPAGNGTVLSVRSAQGGAHACGAVALAARLAAPLRALLGEPPRRRRDVRHRDGAIEVLPEIAPDDLAGALSDAACDPLWPPHRQLLVELKALFPFDGEIQALGTAGSPTVAPPMTARANVCTVG